MVHRTHVLVLLFCLILSFMACTTTVKFKREIPSRAETLILTGKLTKPEGQGPFPALVLLHACDGLREDVYLPWMKRLRTWGYVALLVDSFGPRGEFNLCADERNLLMAARLACIASKNMSEKIKSKILTFVGAAHVEGIKKYLENPILIKNDLKRYGLKYTEPFLIRRVSVENAA